MRLWFRDCELVACKSAMLSSWSVSVVSIVRFGLACSQVGSKWLLLPVLRFLLLRAARGYIAIFLRPMPDDHFCEGCIVDLSQNDCRTVRSLSCLRRRSLLYQLILVFIACLCLELSLPRRMHLGQTSVHVSYHEIVLAGLQKKN